MNATTSVTKPISDPNDRGGVAHVWSDMWCAGVPHGDFLPIHASGGHFVVHVTGGLETFAVEELLDLGATEVVPLLGRVLFCAPACMPAHVLAQRLRTAESLSLLCWAAPTPSMPGNTTEWLTSFYNLCCVHVLPNASALARAFVAARATARHAAGDPIALSEGRAGAGSEAVSDLLSSVIRCDGTLEVTPWRESPADASAGDDAAEGAAEGASESAAESMALAKVGAKVRLRQHAPQSEPRFRVSATRAGGRSNGSVTSPQIAAEAGAFFVEQCGWEVDLHDWELEVQVGWHDAQLVIEIPVMRKLPEQHCLLQQVDPTPSHPVTSRHIMSYAVTCHHIPSHPVTPRRIPSHPVTSRHTPSHPVTSRHIPSHPVTSRRMTHGA
jgi:hypothetical protein